MAAIVKPIEAKSVHLIQSGQVIVDLCSVVKELVENSLDAGANTLEVRFKNNGLDEIEVQDNGAGVAAINYESVALKHYTSKLSTYDDLLSLQTFGFRGEALSSLCALSTFFITTAQAHEAPKGSRLDFEMSGKLKGITVVACQKGTTATVQNLFEKLPVRRKELTKNIKREYGKVLGLLHAYACISTNVKFTVKNAMPKGKSITIFATKANATTRENVANIYGAKTLTALVTLNLSLEYQHSKQLGTNEPGSSHVTVMGHISKPVFGEGRQTPDRQMFFVNGRPCSLPQIAKAINEVYKSFNVSQSPFIVADFQLDTNAYDVNVSPDKRTIFLHNAEALIESLKTSLTELFDQQDQTVPNSNIQASKLPAFRQLSLPQASISPSSASPTGQSSTTQQIERTKKDLETILSPDRDELSNRLLHDHFRGVASTREEPTNLRGDKELARMEKERERRASKKVASLNNQADKSDDVDEYDGLPLVSDDVPSSTHHNDVADGSNVHVRDFNARIAEQQLQQRHRSTSIGHREVRNTELPIATISPSRRTGSPGLVQDTFDRMRPRRLQPEIATITIGDKTITRMIGSQATDLPGPSLQQKTLNSGGRKQPGNVSLFSQGLQRFSASGPETALSDDTDQDGTVSDIPKNLRFAQPFQLPLDSASNEGASEQQSTNTGLEAQRRQIGDVMQQDVSQIDDETHRVEEEDRVAELIRLAEDTAQQRNQGDKRATQVLKSARVKDSIFHLAVDLDFDLEEIEDICGLYNAHVRGTNDITTLTPGIEDETEENAEDRLSLTVSKPDFFNMHIVGQFNLGFIIAVRPKCPKLSERAGAQRDELFIIDQHASDEKYNFERLQAETVVGNQRMVRPAVLELTAVEEETVMENTAALEKNGFVVEIDTSGDQEVGSRCQLVSLPLSKEVVFGPRDLDELIHLLAESPMLKDSQYVPRPSKVRKMFAMRACRSSIMIGKTLSQKQMSTILQHMGTIDKPWNCPHGRPTMRHLASLDALDSSVWKEGDGVDPGDSLRRTGSKSVSQIWRDYVA